MQLFIKSTWNVMKFVRPITSKMNPKVAVGQMTATSDLNHNLKQVKCIIEKATKENAQIVFLPEACDYIAENKEQAIKLAEPLSGPRVTEYKNLAKSNNVWISFGGIHELTANNKAFNTHLVINNLGEIVGIYRKLHLFNVKIPEENIFLVESKTVESGKSIVPPIESPIGKLALSICYDMRFPELAIALRQKGAEILTYPSAFTHATGAAHWEILLRARAIESQCFVIAAAQIGRHNEKRISYGQAIVIDPWGKIIGECEKHSDSDPYEPTVCTAEIDLTKLETVRKKMPVIEHKRTDIYGSIIENSIFELPKEVSTLNFGGIKIPIETVFYKTPYSYAFTNLRCVVPGHVLVSSVRESKRLSDLTPTEVADLFKTAIKVQKAVEEVYKATSSTVVVQDGPEAGQTVKHVHIHIMPRKEGDFVFNDEIYKHIQQHDKEGPNMKPPRCLEEQKAEADILRKIISQ
ncbi:nitrilase and fragile histidine triad fusion protein NitFhit [Chrysoperla carnea]|uniref:nitrilase and fragile histidine triad fusion protein NitFhit n=1 Tax=Chrysoperla carnea TaxID=189513 RepID=UPI001D067DE9|nr:nitrilase and fragile histidine triad fusion protein NitFhit [Chrysoperla carnea]